MGRGEQREKKISQGPTVMETGDTENSALREKGCIMADKENCEVSSHAKQTNERTGSVAHAPLYALVVHRRKHAILNGHSPDLVSECKKTSFLVVEPCEGKAVKERRHNSAIKLTLICEKGTRTGSAVHLVALCLIGETQVTLEAPGALAQLCE